ncbi:MAG: FtsX-like permease family protein [Gemmatimonadota bacterium]
MSPRVRLGFALRLALRESRYGWRRVGVYMASITLGVAALVSIHSFREDFARSVQDEADVLMGANARLSDDVPFTPEGQAIVDSLRNAGVPVARVTTASSMIMAPSTETVRLLQVRALDPGYPFYGDVTTEPAGTWGAHMEPGSVMVDPAVLTQLGVEIGDELIVGTETLRIRGTVDDLPTDLAFQTAIGPRLHLSQETMERAGLLGFGSLARYEAFLELPEIEERRALRERYEALFDGTSLGYTLAEEQAQSLSNGVRFLGRFLALVGLGALLLGGVGVASAIHVYIRERRPGIAVLRCVGASQGTAFLAYLIQAAWLGLLGSAAGVVLGVILQEVMPVALAGILPVEVTTRLSWGSILAGLGIGAWVAVVFALIPLLQVRDVPPLAALRSDFEPPRRRIDPVRALAWIVLAASVLGLAAAEAPEPELGISFAIALVVAALAIAGVGLALTWVTRRFFPTGASYPVRQGVSNLFRPQNQTVSVTLALGFGAFVVGTIVQVESSLRNDLTVSVDAAQPNILLFDIQTDQVDGIGALMQGAEYDVSPLVTARVAGINGRTVEELADAPPDERPEGWTVRREYRNTYRSELGRAEILVRGQWWDGTPGSEDGVAVDAGGLPRLSLEEDIAESLRVSLGDTLTWDVAGIEIETVVTSLRRVEWDRLEPNFFAVFEPGVLESAPQNILMVARVPEASERARIQRDLVGDFPNVSALDFSRVQEAIDAVLTRVRQAVAFLGGFSAIAGIIVLAGALATSRAQRLREGALLKTLGARRRQILTVLFSEYLALGSIATASGLALAVGASALLIPELFEIDYVVRVGPVLVIWTVVVLVTVITGLLGSRDLVRRPPLPVLRGTD